MKKACDRLRPTFGRRVRQLRDDMKAERKDLRDVLRTVGKDGPRVLPKDTFAHILSADGYLNPRFLMRLLVYQEKGTGPKLTESEMESLQLREMFKAVYGCTLQEYETSDLLRVVGHEEIPELALPAFEWKPDQHPLSELLSPQFSPVDFHGRDDEIKELTEWVHRESSLLVRVYHGMGGIGKTRLGMEACRMIRGMPGWLAGIVDRNISRQRWEHILGLKENLLLVFDDAESRCDEINDLLQQCGEFEPGPARIRFVLLARHLHGWWHDARRTEWTLARAVLNHEATTSAVQLGQPATEASCSFEYALKAFSKVLKKEIPRGVQQIDDSESERIIFIQCRALAALEGANVRGKDQLLQWLIEREIRYWLAQLKLHKLPSTLADGIMQAMAVISAIGGVSSFADGLSILKKLAIFEGQTAARLKPILDMLHGCYSTQGFWIGPVAPDLLGQFLLRQRMAEPVARDDIARLVFGLETSKDYRLGNPKAGFMVLAQIIAEWPEDSSTVEIVVKADMSHLAPVALEVAEEGSPLLAKAITGAVEKCQEDDLIVDLAQSVELDQDKLGRLPMTLIKRALTLEMLQDPKNRLLRALLFDRLAFLQLGGGDYKEAAHSVEEAYKLCNEVEALSEQGMVVMLNLWYRIALKFKRLGNKGASSRIARGIPRFFKLCISHTQNIEAQDALFEALAKNAVYAAQLGGCGIRVELGKIEPKDCNQARIRTRSQVALVQPLRHPKDRKLAREMACSNSVLCLSCPAESVTDRGYASETLTNCAQMLHCFKWFELADKNADAALTMIRSLPAYLQRNDFALLCFINLKIRAHHQISMRRPEKSLNMLKEARECIPTLLKESKRMQNESAAVSQVGEVVSLLCNIGSEWIRRKSFDKAIEAAEEAFNVTETVPIEPRSKWAPDLRRLLSKIASRSDRRKRSNIAESSAARAQQLLRGLSSSVKIVTKQNRRFTKTELKRLDHLPYSRPRRGSAKATS